VRGCRWRLRDPAGAAASRFKQGRVTFNNYFLTNNRRHKEREKGTFDL
jgi:hypothetical protein